MNAGAPNPRHTRTKSLIALALSFTAGFVDIVGALTVYDLFTAHVTGTTVRLGERIVQRDWGAVLAAIIIVGSFFAASLAGRVLIEAAQRARFKRIASITFAIEVLLLLVVIAIGVRHDFNHPRKDAAPVVCLVLALLASAMGLQTASLTKIGPLTVHTTFVTGMLNKLAQVLSLWMFAVFDLSRKSADEKRHAAQAHNSARKARLLVAIWIAYLTGAGCGTWATADLHLKSLYLPCCVLLVVIIVDRVRPLSIEEEQEQAE